MEYDFPYRDLIIVNETAEEIKFEIPVFDGSYIEEYEKLGLKVIPVSEHDSYLNLYKKAHAELDACLLYTSPSPRDKRQSRMPSSA